MKIFYLYNSGFAVEAGDTLLVFDCISIDNSKQIGEGFISKSYVESFKRAYFFVSHKHADHYDRRIFNMSSPNVKYILAYGTPGTSKDSKSIFLKRKDTFDDDRIFVKAYGSTDLGVSFLVEIADTSIFFAGDLNCWHWTMDASLKEERMAREAFSSELEFIKEDVGSAKIDIAFFPVDPRMKGNYDDGAMEFFFMFRPSLFVPMHFRQQTDIPKIFSKKIPADTFIISRPGDSKEFNK